jgi:soluble P-type ATPase
MEIFANALEAKDKYSLDGLYVMISVVVQVMIFEVESIASDYSYFITTNGLMISTTDHFFQRIDKVNVELIYDMQRRKSGILSLHEAGVKVH